MGIATYLLLFILLLVRLFVVFADDSNKKSLLPRGVRPQRIKFIFSNFFFQVASFYSSGKTFTCIDGNKVIPFNQVNDDYCDCSDGSDEPGLFNFIS